MHRSKQIIVFGPKIYHQINFLHFYFFIRFYLLITWYYLIIGGIVCSKNRLICIRDYTNVQNIWPRNQCNLIILQFSTCSISKSIDNIVVVSEENAARQNRQKHRVGRWRSHTIFVVRHRLLQVDATWFGQTFIVVRIQMYVNPN